MKILLLLCFIVSSFSLHAQSIFKVAKDKSLSRSLKDCKHNHLIILSKYRSQIDSEIKRLVTGIEYESSRKENELRISSYRNLLMDLLVKRIFVQELEKQLNAVDLDKLVRTEPRQKVFNTENIKIDLAKEMNIHLDAVLDEKHIGHYFLKDLKTNLIKELVIASTVKTYQAVGSGLLAKFVTQGIGQAALKTTILSFGSKIFVSAGTASLLSILTFPLHAYRLPPEHVWTNILKKNPELIINPEWMRYAGSDDDPWFSHNYAILRRTDRVEETLNKFLKSSESSFQSSVIAISKFEKYRPEPKTPKFEYDVRAKVDGTYVHRNFIIQDVAPFWAAKKK